MTTERDKGLSEFKTFSGHLSADDGKLALQFRARVDVDGEVETDLGTIPLTEGSRFLFFGWHRDDGRVPTFVLDGVAEDGTRFSTDTLRFNGMNETTDADGTRMTPKGRCGKALFKRKLAEPAPLPMLKLMVKGFRNFGRLRANTPLGKLVMAGATDIPAPDTITGWIVLQADTLTADVSLWRAEGERLLDHIRQIMSLAAAASLRAPVRQFYCGDDLHVEVRSQGRRSTSAMPVFHYLNQQPVFDAAVNCFFNPPFKHATLIFAIDWFAMDATYTEVRLVNAMTALENLVDSNLREDEELIQPRKEFEKTRRALRQFIRACLSKWAPSAADEALLELNEKLADLNRRSLLRKLRVLADRWHVPLADISEDSIKAAKRARDKVIHRGQYYEDARDTEPDLWSHVTIIRELAVRFFLTAIGYQGQYLSYVGGYHQAPFPPQARPNA